MDYHEFLARTEQRHHSRRMKWNNITEEQQTSYSIVIIIPRFNFGALRWCS